MASNRRSFVNAFEFHSGRTIHSVDISHHKPELRVNPRFVGLLSGTRRRRLAPRPQLSCHQRRPNGKITRPEATGKIEQGCHTTAINERLTRTAMTASPSLTTRLFSGSASWAEGGLGARIPFPREGRGP